MIRCWDLSYIAIRSGVVVLRPQNAPKVTLTLSSISFFLRQVSQVYIVHLQGELKCITERQLMQSKVLYMLRKINDEVRLHHY